MKNWLIGIMSFVWVFGLLSLAPVSVQAQTTNMIDPWGPGVTTSYTEQGISSVDPRQTVAKIIKIALGFLGSIAVILVIVAGFKWMTAAGNDDSIKKAKDLMGAAFVGLVIILLAFAITNFVINAVITSI
jgi:type IV secretory pathway VirB2 component (pilin)